MKPIRLVPLVGVLFAGSALAEQVPADGGRRNGAMRQAMVNTLCASYVARALSCLDGTGKNALTFFNQAITDLTNSGAATANAGLGAGYALTALGANVPTGTQVGLPGRVSYRWGPASMSKKDGSVFTNDKGEGCVHWSDGIWCLKAESPGWIDPILQGKGEWDGSPWFGGGGPTGDWLSDCKKFTWKVINNTWLLIPSVSVKKGSRIGVAPEPDAKYSKADKLGGGGWWAGSSNDAAALWTLHNYNMGIPDKRDWFGMARAGEDGWYRAYNVPRMKDDNSGYTNWATLLFSAGYTETNASPGPDQGQPVEPCPNVASAGTPYGNGIVLSDGAWRILCTEYFSGPGMGLDGYAVNPQISMPIAAIQQYFGSLDRLVKYLDPSASWCPIDKDILKKLVDAAALAAAAKPGYNGPAPQPVRDEHARPGDVRVADLGDNPTDDVLPTQPTTVPETPSGGGTTTPGGSTGYKDECDFGPGGCDNPNTGEPSLDEPNTSIMDPIFDWLPDLPSITIPDMSASCPTWALNLTEYGGSDWVFLIDKHCELLGGNDSTLRDAIGLLCMGLAMWWAARHILSA